MKTIKTKGSYGTKEFRFTISEIQKKYNINKVLFGSGYNVEEPNIVVVGYDVFVYPEGKGYGKKCIYINLVK